MLLHFKSFFNFILVYIRGFGYVGQTTLPGCNVTIPVMGP